MEITEEERQRIQDKVDKLKQSKFKQQMLPAWRPVPSFASTMVTFSIFGVIFLSLGVALYVMSNQIQEVVQRYDDSSSCKIGEKCEIQIELTEDIQAPIYMYYQLENFYQNHRRYVKSRDYQQLMGETRTLEQVKDSCDPILTNGDVSPNLKSAFAPYEKLNPDDVAIPCGLVAKSFFTDNFNLYLGSKNITFSEDNIAWDSDVKYKFANSETPELQWMDMTNRK